MKENKIYNLCISAIMLTLLIICSKITIPFGVIPLTLQTFCVIIAGLILGWKYSLFVFATYILLGLLGLPVFSQGGGLAYIYKPSFGFIIGFMVQSLITGLVKPNSKFYTKYILSFIGLAIIYLFGAVYMYLILNYHMHLNKNVAYVMSAGVTPFILKDSISAVLACLVYSRVRLIMPSYKKNFADAQINNETENKTLV